MKISIWDILTGITLLAILCLVAAFMVIAINPGVPFNPLPPPATVVPLIIPTATESGPNLPPTWTPLPGATEPQQQAPEVPTLRPSRTPEPTATRVILPTFTASVTARPGTVSGGGTSGGTGSGSGNGVGGGACKVVYQNPEDETVMPRGASFDTRWTIKNTSNDSWRSDSVDLRFQSGSRMHSGSDARDLQYEVGPSGSIDILISMTAPSNKGTFTSNWALVAGSKALCRFYVTITVE